MDMEMLKNLSNAFGPSGFEEDVIRAAARYLTPYQIENDAMNNLYARMSGTDSEKPVIQLDAHLDECGFMVQCIHDNGCLGIIMLGGFHLTNIPAHSVVIRTRSGNLIKGIITSKPVHFMTEDERNSQNLDIGQIYVDIGAINSREVEEAGISIGDPMIPDVSFEYHEQQGVCFGKAFDNRAGCACIIDTMDKLREEKNRLAVQVVGAFAAQEEVGMRGAEVTSQIVKPDLAIVFEGSPSDDFFFSPGIAQGKMKGGVQIRLMDKSYISNPAFTEFAVNTAKKFGIRFQETVRRGGSTNAGRISLTGKAVPVLVLGVPSRYVHTHYNYCAREDLEAAVELASKVILELDNDAIRHICRQDILDKVLEER
ncbi:M42 family metallopeptidase [Lacrimispora sp. 38-1]|uniref:M42 family metallopeptidase n=1 Tax=Lacrimispora sp. 38-1 TaxID=3125778 RepID=UPI003CF7E253